MWQSPRSYGLVLAGKGPHFVTISRFLSVINRCRMGLNGKRIPCSNFTNILQHLAYGFANVDFKLLHRIASLIKSSPQCNCMADQGNPIDAPKFDRLLSGQWDSYWPEHFQRCLSHFRAHHVLVLFIRIPQFLVWKLFSTQSNLASVIDPIIEVSLDNIELYGRKPYGHKGYLTWGFDAIWSASNLNDSLFVTNRLELQ